MARVIYVKKAQQRFATKPVLDEDGNPKRVPLTDKRTGEQKRTKHGRLVTKALTVADKDRPLPNATCEKCGKEIQPGTPYKWVKPKSGPYGGRKRFRCDACPTWQPWDLSYSVSAQAQRLAHEFSEGLAGVESVDEVQSLLDELAQQVRDELAEQRRESAENMREGFGHDTYQSEQLDSDADELESWADEIESADIPDPDDFQDECDTCEGTGEVTNSCPECAGSGRDEETASGLCDECDGSGEVEDTCDDCGGTGQSDEPDYDAWREEVQQALSVVDECPI